MPHCKKKVTDIPVLSRDVTTFFTVYRYRKYGLRYQRNIFNCISNQHRIVSPFFRIWLIQHVEVHSKYCVDAEKKCFMLLLPEKGSFFLQFD
jgi:hypothetical protein